MFFVGNVSNDNVYCQNKANVVSIDQSSHCIRDMSSPQLRPVYLKCAKIHGLETAVLLRAVSAASIACRNWFCAAKLNIEHDYSRAQSSVHNFEEKYFNVELTVV